MSIYGETYSKFKANDMIENNYFDTDTWWGKQVNITIADGVSHYIATPPGNGLYRLSLLTIGLTYTITFTILNYVDGGISGTNGLFEDITYTIQVSDGTTVYNFFDGYLDFIDEKAGIICTCFC